MELPTPCGLVTLLTDFGAQDPYVGVMKGVIKQLHPRADIVDLTHGVPPHDIAAGGLFLTAAVGRFPLGTVHVAVVDPGVGTERATAAACAGGCYWIGPDNGLLAPAVRAAGGEVEVRRLDLQALRLPPPSRTFWGRDVFAPAAALLSSRRFGFRSLGPRADRLAEQPAVAGPRVVAIDRFGNLITSIRAAELAARPLRALAIKGHRIPVRGTYADVEPGAAVAVIGSYDLLEIAVCQGSAAALLGAGPGEPVSACEEHE